MAERKEQIAKRVVIERVEPEIDGGIFPLKRTVDEDVTVDADIFLEGSDSLDAVLLDRHESEDWQALWDELKSVFEFWVDQGVRIFRVDNPRTKPFAFWKWAFGDLKARYPGLIFLSEAFTRPKIMCRLRR